MCSAREAGHLLSELVRGQVLQPSHAQALIGLMETTAYNDWINYYLGAVPIAHKVRFTDGGVANDVGIVYLSGKPFVISILTYTSNPDAAVEAIRDVARAAALYFS